MRKGKIYFAFLSLMIGLSTCLMGCSREKINQEEKQIYEPGSYIYTTQGEYGEMEVEIVLSETSIEQINILSSHDTNAMLEEVRTSYIANILILQNTEIDMISGSTGSCQGVYEAVSTAVKEHAYEKTE